LGARTAAGWPQGQPILAQRFDLAGGLAYGQVTERMDLPMDSRPVPAGTTDCSDPAATFPPDGPGALVFALSTLPEVQSGEAITTGPVSPPGAGTGIFVNFDEQATAVSGHELYEINYMATGADGGTGPLVTLDVAHGSNTASDMLVGLGFEEFPMGMAVPPFTWAQLPLTDYVEGPAAAGDITVGARVTGDAGADLARVTLPNPGNAVVSVFLIGNLDGTGQAQSRLLACSDFAPPTTGLAACASAAFPVP